MIPKLDRHPDGTAKVGPWRLTNDEANVVDHVANVLGDFDHNARIRILGALAHLFRESESADQTVPRGTAPHVVPPSGGSPNSAIPNPQSQINP
jgi:hypothetical protein